MKKIPVIRQDILDADIDILIQQCNCYGVMGAGLAKSIRSAYPEAHEVDVAFPLPFGRERLGHWSVANVFHRHTNEPLQIINVYGQVNFGRQHKQTDEYALIGALQRIFDSIHQHHLDHGVRLKVGIPWKIGCGLGGGDWDLVLLELTRSYNETGVDIRLYQI